MMSDRVTQRVTMAAPAPGFTMRVMARIQERERQTARRRALVGAGLLAVTGLVPFALAGAVLVGVWVALSSNPDLLTTGLVALGPILDITGTVLNAIWLGGETVVSRGSAQLLAYSLGVLALTLFWARIVGGSFRLSSHTVDTGGS